MKVPLDQKLPDSLLPLSSQVFYILVALADGDLHGYAVREAVYEKSNGTVLLGPGTLYGAISRLLENGLIEETMKRSDSDDPRRRYYRLTKLGRQTLVAEMRRLEGLVKVAKSTSVVRKLKPAKEHL